MNLFDADGKVKFQGIWTKLEDNVGKGFVAPSLYSVFSVYAFVFDSMYITL